MTGLYLFAVAVGVPLVAWFLFGGDSGDGGGDGGGDGAGPDEGIGAIMLRRLPLSSMALAAAAFGITGLALGAAGTSAAVAFAGAVVAAVIGAVLNSTAFSYLRRTESTVDASDARLAGSVGRVVLPVGPGRRGRIALTVGDQQVYLSAEAHRSLDTAAGERAAELEVGAQVLVVEVRHGIATVTRLDPELT
jgi:hypothetical protein